MRTGIVTDERFLDHDTGKRHPECADRLRAIGRWLNANPVPDRVRIDARDATVQELTRVHVPEHVERVEASSHLPRYAFDADTPVSSSSFAAACRAAGGVLALVDAVMARRRSQRLRLRSPARATTPSAIARWAFASSTTSRIARRPLARARTASSAS